MLHVANCACELHNKLFDQQKMVASQSSSLLSLTTGKLLSSLRDDWDAFIIDTGRQRGGCLDSR